MLPKALTETPVYAMGDVITYLLPNDLGTRTAVVTAAAVYPGPGFDGYILGDMTRDVHGDDTQIVAVLGRYRRAVVIGDAPTIDNLRRITLRLPPNYMATSNHNQILIEGWDVKGSTLVGNVFPKLAKIGARIREIPA